MPEIDYEAEYHRLYERMVELEKAQYALATAGINDSARWELERRKMEKEQETARLRAVVEISARDREITKLSAELGRYILLRKSAADEIATLSALLHEIETTPTAGRTIETRNNKITETLVPISCELRERIQDALPKE